MITKEIKIAYKASLFKIALKWHDPALLTVTTQQHKNTTQKCEVKTFSCCFSNVVHA